MSPWRASLAVASALVLATPALAEPIPTIASGEAADREQALTNALRHAVEQVVGMTMDSTTYVHNLKSIDDRILASAAGFIDKYQVVQETRDGGEVRVTVSALVSREKVEEAASSIGAGIVTIDGKVLAANAALDLARQQEDERAMAEFVNQLPDRALAVSFKVESEADAERPDQVVVHLADFKEAIEPAWYERYREFHDGLALKPWGRQVLAHGGQYGSFERYVRVPLVAEVLTGGQILWSGPVAETYSICANTCPCLFEPEVLPLVPPDLQAGGTIGFSVPRALFERATGIRVAGLSMDRATVPWEVVPVKAANYPVELIP